MFFHLSMQNNSSERKISRYRIWLEIDFLTGRDYKYPKSIVVYKFGTVEWPNFVDFINFFNYLCQAPNFFIYHLD